MSNEEVLLSLQSTPSSKKASFSLAPGGVCCCVALGNSSCDGDIFEFFLFCRATKVKHFNTFADGKKKKGILCGSMMGSVVAALHK